METSKLQDIFNDAKSKRDALHDKVASLLKDRMIESNKNLREAVPLDWKVKVVDQDDREYIMRRMLAGGLAIKIVEAWAAASAVFRTLHLNGGMG